MRTLRIFATLLIVACLTPLVSVPSTAQTRGLTLKTNYPFVVSEAGKSVKFGIDAITPTPRAVNLSIAAIPDGWQADLRGGGFLVGAVFGDPENPPQLELDVRVPAETGPGDYQVVLQGTTSVATDRLTLTIRISDQAPGAVNLTTEFPEQRGTPSDSFTFRLTLENNTPEETSFSLSARGPEGWQVSAQPSEESRAATVSVEGGATTDIQVIADPPDQAPAGEYEIQVTAAGGAGAETTATLKVEITGTTTLAVSTSDQRLNRSGVAGRANEITFVVRNEGTAPLEGVRVTATAPTGWEMTFEPEVVDAIAPGESSEVTGRVVAAGDAVAGDYSITINANAQAGGSDSLELRYTVRASRVWGLIGLLLIVAVLFGLRWVFQRYGRR